MSNLPPIFIESSGHAGGMTIGLPDMWAHPEGKFVRAIDYLALKQRFDNFQIDTLAAEHMRDLERGITCDKCGNYFPGHATGASDICTCDDPSCRKHFRF